MGNPTTFAAPKLPRRLAEYTGAQAPGYYSFIYPRLVDGVLPSEQRPNGRYYIREDDVPLIAEKLGLKRMVQTAA